MKPYTVSIDIDLPRAEVIEKFDNSENLLYWQEGLQSFEHLEGEPGQPGAKSKLTFLLGKRKMELIEEIHLNELPDRFDGSYRWDGGYNTLENRFTELGPRQTRWESNCSYEFSSFMLKVFAVLAPGMFKKQQMKYLTNFKAFCEHGADVRAS